MSCAIFQCLFLANTFTPLDLKIKNIFHKSASYVTHFCVLEECNIGNACKDEMWNAEMKLDDSLTEVINMMWKVAVDLFLFDSTTLSLDDDYLRLRSKFCATLGLMRNHDPCEGHGPNHHGDASMGTNFILAGWIESA